MHHAIRVLDASGSNHSVQTVSASTELYFAPILPYPYGFAWVHSVLLGSIRFHSPSLGCIRLQSAQNKMSSALLIESRCRAVRRRHCVGGGGAPVNFDSRKNFVLSSKFSHDSF